MRVSRAFYALSRLVNGCIERISKVFDDDVSRLIEGFFFSPKVLLKIATMVLEESFKDFLNVFQEYF